MKFRTLFIPLGAVLGLGHCNRRTEPDPHATNPDRTVQENNPGGIPGVPLGVPFEVPGSVPATGPRAELNAANYTLTVALAPVDSPGDTVFTLELHGSTGYHVNEQYPIAIDLEFSHATAAKTALRRADALEVSEARARFSLPVHTTGPAATVRGSARFAVCSSENCVPETRRFALVIP